MWPDLTLSAHNVVILLIWAVCYCEELLQTIHTPNILEAWEGRSCWISILPSRESIVRLGDWYASRHLPAMYQINSSKYHLVFETLSFPPVDLAATANMLRLS